MSEDVACVLPRWSLKGNVRGSASNEGRGASREAPLRFVRELKQPVLASQSACLPTFPDTVSCRDPCAPDSRKHVLRASRVERRIDRSRERESTIDISVSIIESQRREQRPLQSRGFRRDVRVGSFRMEVAINHVGIGEWIVYGVEWTLIYSREGTRLRVYNSAHPEACLRSR